MQATIFGDNIALYGKAVKFGKEYEITNAKIKPMKEQYPMSEEQYEIEVVSAATNNFRRLIRGGGFGNVSARGP